MADINFAQLTNELVQPGDVTRALSATIAGRVAGMIRERAAHGLPTFRLAQAGNVLGPELRRLERLTGRRLIDIVRDDLGYDVRSAPDSPHAPFIALRTDATPPTQRARLPDGLWSAFTTPLPGGMARRFLVAGGYHLDGYLRDDEGCDGVPIPEALIRPNPPKHLSDVVAVAIEGWMRAHRIEMSALGASHLADGRRPSAVQRAI